MSKHAPGPWKTTHSEVTGYRVSDSTGWGVAVVLKDTNDEANARLIAAAPAVLEALEAACEKFENMAMAICEDKDCEVCLIGKAIRAAKGE